MSITENLMQKRLDKLIQARDEHNFLNLWINDGRVFFKDGNNKVKVD